MTTTTSRSLRDSYLPFRGAFPAGSDWAAVPECPVRRPTRLLTAPKPRGCACRREMLPCLCVCALVCLGGGGGGTPACSTVVQRRRSGKCVPGAPSPREARAQGRGGEVGMTPWSRVGRPRGDGPPVAMVCCSRRWWRLLADRHLLPFPWTPSLHRRWCPSASHRPVTFLFLPALTFPLPFPFLSLGLSLHRLVPIGLSPLLPFPFP